MTFLILLLAVLIAYFVYKQTRSLIWGGGTLVLAILLLPVLFDQVALLAKMDNSGPPVTANNSFTGINSTTATSCNCTK
jgi:hypothetical protein